MKLDTETLVLALRECQQHPNISKALLQAADCLEEIANENKKLKIELQEANDYADKLVTHKDMVCLPADLTNLREANARFAFDNHMLRDKLNKLERSLKATSSESFDTWWNDQDNGCPTLVLDNDKEFAQAVWNAAIESTKKNETI
jgi:predicted nuclease with TOPRIM domain